MCNIYIPGRDPSFICYVTDAKMSGHEELVRNMPCGYAADTGDKLTFEKVKSSIRSIQVKHPKLRGVAIIEEAKIIPIKINKD